jgi:hypothetical protein
MQESPKSALPCKNSEPCFWQKQIMLTSPAAHSGYSHLEVPFLVDPQKLYFFFNNFWLQNSTDSHKLVQLPIGIVQKCDKSSILFTNIRPYIKIVPLSVLLNIPITNQDYGVFLNAGGIFPLYLLKWPSICYLNGCLSVGAHVLSMAFSTPNSDNSQALTWYRFRSVCAKAVLHFVPVNKKLMHPNNMDC